MESKCYVITLNWTTGCESETTSTEVKAVCLTLSEAETTKNHIAQTINWDNHYEGYLDIEPIPFYSDLIEASKDVVKMWPEIEKSLPNDTDTEQGQSQAIFVAFHKLESTLQKANTNPLNDETLEAMGFTEEYHYWHLGDFKLTKVDDGLAFSHNGKLIQYTHELYELGIKAKED